MIDTFETDNSESIFYCDFCDKNIPKSDINGKSTCISKRMRAWWKPEGIVRTFCKKCLDKYKKDMVFHFANPSVISMEEIGRGWVISKKGNDLEDIDY